MDASLASERCKYHSIHSYDALFDETGHARLN